MVGEGQGDDMKTIDTINDGRSISFNCDGCGMQITTNRLEVSCMKCGQEYEIIYLAIPKENNDEN